MAGAYEGLRVLDFTQGIAGPMACGLLAQHGADVLKVEPPGGDRMQDHPGYIAWNCNKRRIELDLTSVAGLAEVKRLIVRADVAVFDAPPGELERLGLDGATLTREHPGLVHAWLPMWGTAGCWADMAPVDSLLAAASCISFAQSSWEDVPVHLVTPQVSYGHAITAAGAISAAVFERQRSGLGQAVICSGVHGYSAVRSGGAIRAATMQRLGAGRGSRGGSPNYRLYQCGDGEWLFLATLTLPFFLKALEALDLLELLAMEGVEGEIANLQKPPTNEEVIARLDARFAEKPRAEWLEILKQFDAPAGPVGERNAWFAGEQVAANEMRVELEHPVHGRFSVPGVSAKLTQTPGQVRGLMRDATPAEVEAWGTASRTVAPGERKNGPPPLDGIRVLDMGVVIAGPFGPTVLANYGADAIKVEPRDGDSFRTAALGFAGWNRGKRSVGLDLKDPADLQRFYDLVRTSDVVVDNFRKGVVERLKIDYATLSAINPRIICVSVMGYGPDGPYASEPGFDPILQARSGMMEAQGHGDEPVFHTVPVNDEASGLMSAFATLAALNAREKTGRGQQVWTSLANQSVVCQSGELTWYDRRPAAPLGGRDCRGERALHGLYECGDGWVAIAVTADGQWPALCEALGRPQLADLWDAAKAMAEPREEELGANLDTAFASTQRDDIVARLRAAGVPAVPAIRPEEAHDDSWLTANRFWEEYELPGHGLVSGVRGYAEFSRTPGGFTRPAPQLGEHNDEILGALTAEAHAR
jgi:crotonobetainyl-CoA:carnitine CoA-transferase CaiB-like acyl-CoA transferase